MTDVCEVGFVWFPRHDCLDTGISKKYLRLIHKPSLLTLLKYCSDLQC